MRSSAQQLTKTLRGVEVLHPLPYTTPNPYPNPNPSPTPDQVLKFLTISQLQRLQDALSEVRRDKANP